MGRKALRYQKKTQAICDASWSTGACILFSSVVGAPQQKRRQQQQHILESRGTCFFSYSYSLLFWGFCTTTSTTMLIKESSYTHTYSPDVPVMHTPVEVRFSMTCRFVRGQGKRGNAHIPVIMSVAFPLVVVFDGFISLWNSLFTVSYTHLTLPTILLV